MNREQLQERMEYLQDLYWSLYSRDVNVPEWINVEYHGLVDQLADIEEAEQAIDTIRPTMQ